MILASKSMRACDYYEKNDEYFKISDIDSKFLKKYNISMTISKFKNLIRESKPFKYVETGGSNYAFRRTAIYKISDFKNIGGEQYDEN